MTIVWNTSHQSYWNDLKEAVKLINIYKRLLKTAKDSQQYIAGNWSDELGAYEPVENLGPWDDVEDASKAILHHPRARTMAEAQNLSGRRWRQ